MVFEDSLKQQLSSSSSSSRAMSFEQLAMACTYGHQSGTLAVAVVAAAVAVDSTFLAFVIVCRCTEIERQRARDYSKRDASNNVV